MSTAKAADKGNRKNPETTPFSILFGTIKTLRL
jgi:hypothetical protein